MGVKWGSSAVDLLQCFDLSASILINANLIPLTAPFVPRQAFVYYTLCTCRSPSSQHQALKQGRHVLRVFQDLQDARSSDMDLHDWAPRPAVLGRQLINY